MAGVHVEFIDRNAEKQNILTCTMWIYFGERTKVHREVAVDTQPASRLLCPHRRGISTEVLQMSFQTCSSYLTVYRGGFPLGHLAQRVGSVLSNVGRSCYPSDVIFFHTSLKMVNLDNKVEDR